MGTGLYAQLLSIQGKLSYIKSTESYLSWVVANLFDVVANLFHDFIVALLAVLGFCRIHLVQADNHLPDSQGVSQEGMFTGLAVLGNTSLKATRGRIDDEHAAIGLGSAGDHVLDEVTVTRGIDDSTVVFWCLELPQSDINGNAPFTLSLQLVQHLRSQATLSTQKVVTCLRQFE